MTSRAVALTVIRREAVTQFRSGLTALYLGMPLVWILIARLVPEGGRAVVVLIGLFSDPVMTGTIFTGAFLAGERDQGLFEAWAVTPMSVGDWLVGRALVIGVQGSLGAALLVLGAGISADFLLLIPGIFLASLCWAFTGLLLARPFRDIMSFFVIGGLASAVLSIPVAGGLLIGNWYWLLTGPAWPGWLVLSKAVNLPAGVESPGAAVGLTALAVWAALLFFLDRRIYDRGFYHRPGRPAS